MEILDTRQLRCLKFAVQDLSQDARVRIKEDDYHDRVVGIATQGELLDSKI